MGWQVCTAKGGGGHRVGLHLLEASVLYFGLLVCFKSLTVSSFNYGCFSLIELVVFEEITVKTRLEGILLVV